MRWTVLLLFISKICSGQFAIDMQRVRCNADSTMVTLYLVNHIDSINPEVPIWNFDGQICEAAGALVALLPGDTFMLSPRKIAIFSYDFSFNCLGSTSENYYTLEPGCTYALHVLNDFDSSSYWYLGKTFELPLHYAIGKHAFRPTWRPVLDDLAGILLRDTAVNIEIAVHGDERMSKEYSTCITCLRAEELRNYLIYKGVDEKRVTANGYQGKQPLIVGAKREEEHQQNRRTVITITAIE